ncbi:hypothetical protein AR540_12145 [Pseudomonas sp. EpS/L25]|nr:hypothetical protein AR540_12145 [Pseudomonas sp. EpS/L25]
MAAIKCTKTVAAMGGGTKADHPFARAAGAEGLGGVRALSPRGPVEEVAPFPRLHRCRGTCLIAAMAVR